MEPTLALRHADRCFAIVDGCATAMNNAKMAEWACPIKQISCFLILPYQTDVVAFRSSLLWPHI